ncbi:hypothetical protein B566_EDAN006596 [Ephemera danica]|nr:hypothetical protein B566_EDAN006596 [Ephemera danica]
MLGCISVQDEAEQDFMKCPQPNFQDDLTFHDKECDGDLTFHGEECDGEPTPMQQDDVVTEGKKEQTPSSL